MSIVWLLTGCSRVAPAPLTPAPRRAQAATRAVSEASSTDGYVIDLSFDGETIIRGDEDDARLNTSTVELLTGEHSPYDHPDRDDILAEAQSLLSPLRVCVTDTRPPDDHDHRVIVESRFSEASIASLTDCNDLNPDNISRVKTSYTASRSARLTGSSVNSLAELSWTEFKKSPCDLMSTSSEFECDVVDA